MTIPFSPAGTATQNGMDALAAPLLELCGVRAAYDGVAVLHGVDLAVPAGQVVALLGPNGAGKTTTLRVAAGVHPVRGGRLRLAGRDLAGARARDLARAGVCLIPEGRGVFPNLSIRDNLWMMTFTGRSRAEVEEIAYARFPILGKHASRAAGTLSGGEQQMLAISRCLMGAPELVMFDEPSLGLAPAVVQSVLKTVRDLNRDGLTCVLVEQNVAVSLKLADHAYVLENGRITLAGAKSIMRSAMAAGFCTTGANAVRSERKSWPMKVGPLRKRRLRPRHGQSAVAPLVIR